MGTEHNDIFQTNPIDTIDVLYDYHLNNSKMIDYQDAKVMRERYRPGFNKIFCFINSAKVIKPELQKHHIIIFTKNEQTPKEIFKI